jgi:fumarate reductase iron-sulfur subunit
VRKVARDGRLTIEPLRNLPRIKDLACDMTPFFDKWQRAGGRFEGSANRGDAIPRIEPSSRERRAAAAAIACIHCAVCYSACDTVTWNPDYLGPAALNRAWTLINDTRHAERRRVLDAMETSGGCYACHSHGSCVERCPVELNPTASIAGLKRRVARRVLLPGDN